MAIRLLKGATCQSLFSSVAYLEKTSDWVSIVQISHKEAATGRSQISYLSL